jgi:hypothetical protein
MAIAMSAAIPNAATLVKRPAINAREPANPHGYCQEIKQSRDCIYWVKTLILPPSRSRKTSPEPSGLLWNMACG